MQDIRFIEDSSPKLNYYEGEFYIGFPKNKRDYERFNLNSHIRIILTTLAQRKLTVIDQHVTKVTLHITLLDDSIFQLLFKIVKRFSWMIEFELSLCGRSFRYTQETARFITAINSHPMLTSFVFANFENSCEMNLLLSPFEENKKIERLIIQNGSLDFNIAYPHVLSRLVKSCKSLKTLIIDCQMFNCVFYNDNKCWYPDQSKLIESLSRNENLIQVELPLLCNIEKNFIDFVTKRNQIDDDLVIDDITEHHPFSHFLFGTSPSDPFLRKKKEKRSKPYHPKKKQKKNKSPGSFYLIVPKCKH